MIQIDDCLVSSEILTEHFSCDYETCRGACCVVGDSGAPLTEEEADSLEAAFPVYSPFMCQSGREAVDKTGFFEIDRDGDMVTPLMPLSRAERKAQGLDTVLENTDMPCAFTLFENGSVFCAVERAHCKGLCSFVKPISCRLYPIRVSVLSNGLKALNLHRWDLCRCAFEKGKRDGTLVYQFLRTPITAAFGEEFYKQLEAAAELLRAEAE
ncbi:MAG: DUF3109 family protein [Bacteroidales bacterium]|nr:DUF3109 family protein [Bacteroidales bacterium]